MRQEIIHTPEGVRDIYHLECKRKLELQNKLHQVLHAYGYQDISTPTFEFQEVFRKEIGTISTKEVYRFFDRDGNILALRPDITPSIARAAATLMNLEEMPARLCYIGNTFINYSSYQGHLKENTQMGAEFIGMDSVEADAEMIALAIACLKQAGLKEFQLNIGHVDFYESLVDAAKLEGETEIRLRELITNRNYFGVDELLEEVDANAASKEAFAMLPKLNGGIEVLKKAQQTAPNERALQAILRLTAIYQLLEAYKVQDYVTFDLSMSGNYLYYTGIIFRGYTYGTGDAIVKGGRYNELLSKFGKSSPSVGFAVVVDELINALLRQKISIPCKNSNTLVLYDDGRQKEAISLAAEFRKNGRYTELLKRDTSKAVEAYGSYGKQNMAESMLYLHGTKGLRIVNLNTQEEKEIGSI